MLSPRFVVNKDLRKEVGLLNHCGALKTKIKDIIGKDRDILVKEFIDKIDEVPEDAPEALKIPASVITLYNSIVDGTDPTPEEEAAANALKSKKKASKPRGDSYEKKGYNLVKSMKGKSLEEMRKAAFDLFKPIYAVQTPPKTDPLYVQGRANIYVGIGIRDLKREEDTPVDATA